MDRSTVHSGIATALETSQVHSGIATGLVDLTSAGVRHDSHNYMSDGVCLQAAISAETLDATHVANTKCKSAT